MLEIRFDDEKLKQVQRELRNIPRALPKVMSRGLNRTVMSARTQFARGLAGRIGLTVKRVRDKLILQRATYGNWRSAIKISNKRIPIIQFKARQTKKGVTYKDYETGKRGFIRHAFIATMKSGHRGVFLRRGRERLPIDEQLGKPFSEVFSEFRDRDGYHLVKESAAKLAKNIHDQVNLILRRRLPA